MRCRNHLDREAAGICQKHEKCTANSEPNASSGRCQRIVEKSGFVVKRRPDRLSKIKFRLPLFR